MVRSYRAVGWSWIVIACAVVAFTIGVGVVDAGLPLWHLPRFLVSEGSGPMAYSMVTLLGAIATVDGYRWGRGILACATAFACLSVFLASAAYVDPPPPVWFCLCIWLFLAVASLSTILLAFSMGRSSVTRSKGGSAPDPGLAP